VEWRVIRALDPDEVQDLSVSFFVMLDGRDTVVSDHAGYQDLGDLPYESWLEDSYRGAGAKTVRSGEVKLENGESLEEVELARFTVDREISEADQIFSSDSSESGEEDIHESDTLKRITEEVGRPDGARVAEIDLIIEEMKAEERRYRREAWITKSKINFLESLSNQKERLTQRLQKRVKELQEEIEALQKNERAQRENNPFKDKALQMFEALSKAKRENQILERDLADLRRRQALAPDQEGFGDSERQAAARNLEETLKKLDRTQRALDAEKTKSAQLSARAISAEKELAKADPIIKDLEMKIETIMKTSNQAKKEVENIKQRLVQAEGEKNRIQNELVKAQAQISTLMKRHAS
jgi:chromosome segregation ATPase